MPTESRNTICHSELGFWRLGKRTHSGGVGPTAWCIYVMLVPWIPAQARGIQQKLIADLTIKSSMREESFEGKRNGITLNIMLHVTEKFQRMAMVHLFDYLVENTNPNDGKTSMDVMWTYFGRWRILACLKSMEIVGFAHLNRFPKVSAARYDGLTVAWEWCALERSNLDTCPGILWSQ